MRGGGEEFGAVGRANRRRGEVEAVIGGERRILCLTLGALAELETALGAESLADLGQRFAAGRLTAADLMCILGAGLRGGGNRLRDEDLAEMTVEGGIAGAAAVVRDLLVVTFAPGHEPGGGAGMPDP